MTRPRIAPPRSLSALLVAVLLTGCGGSTEPPPPEAITDLTVQPPALTLLEGTVARLDIVAQARTPPTYSFRSSDPGVATLDEGGVVRAIAPGTATLTVQASASGPGLAATTLSRNVTVTVQPAPPALRGLDVTPTPVTVVAGSTQRLTVTPDRAAPTVTVATTYRSSATAVATVSTDGLISAVAPGTATITVTATGSGTGFRQATVTRDVPVTVTPKPPGLTALTVTPTTLDVGIAENAALRATVEGPERTFADVTFTSSDPAVATVSTGGFVTGVRQGQAEIVVTARTAETPRFRATELRTVVPVVVSQRAALTDLGVAPTALTLTGVGSTAQIQAAALGPAALSPQLTYGYVSSALGVATVTASGRVTAVGRGTATITVTASHPATTAWTAATISRTVAVTVIAAPALTGLVVTPSPVEFVGTGGTLPLTARLEGPGASSGLATVSYVSSAPGVAQVSASGEVQAVAPGSATITVTATHPETSTLAAATVTRQVAVTVAPQPTVTALPLEQFSGFFAGAAGTTTYFQVTVPAGSPRLVVQSVQGTGEVELLVRRGALPTVSTFDARANSTTGGAGAVQSLTVDRPAAGAWFIGVRAASAIAGVRALASQQGTGCLLLQVGDPAMLPATFAVNGITIGTVTAVATTAPTNCFASAQRAAYTGAPGFVDGTIRTADGRVGGPFGLLVIPAGFLNTYTFNADNVGPPAQAPGYQIDVVPVGSLPAIVLDAATAAARRWSRVIVGDVPAATTTIASGQCTDWTPGFDGTIDDVRVYVRVAPLVPGRLAEAGACFVRVAPGARHDYLPFMGTITLNANLIAQMQRDGTLYSTMLHEMGHVLGFAPDVFRRKALATGLGSLDPVFTGSLARQAFASVGFYPGVPVPLHNAGGPGTADSHWRLRVFGDELMDPDGAPGERAPLSVVTVGAFGDLGYEVNRSAADPYTLPPPSLRDATSDRPHYTDVVLPLAPRQPRAILTPIGTAPRRPAGALPPGSVGKVAPH